MSENLPIRNVSKKYNISARTLRYYEQINILESCRSENRKYREYNESQINRLELILLLRRLSFTIAEITQFLQNTNTSVLESIARKKIIENNLQLLELTETNGLLNQVLNELSKTGISHINPRTILEASLYVSPLTERMIPMSSQNSPIYSLAIGINIVPMVMEDGGNLLSKIKAYRNSLGSDGEKIYPVMRIYDTPDVGNTAAVLTWNDEKVWEGDLGNIDPSVAADMVMEQIKIQCEFV